MSIWVLYHTSMCLSMLMLNTHILKNTHTSFIRIIETQCAVCFNILLLNFQIEKGEDLCDLRKEYSIQNNVTMGIINKMKQKNTMLIFSTVNGDIPEVSSLTMTTFLWKKVQKVMFIWNISRQVSIPTNTHTHTDAHTYIRNSQTVPNCKLIQCPFEKCCVIRYFVASNYCYHCVYITSVPCHIISSFLFRESSVYYCIFNT